MMMYTSSCCRVAEGKGAGGEERRGEEKRGQFGCGF